MPEDTIYAEIASSLAELNLDKTMEGVQKALETGKSANEIVMKGLARGMDAVGALYEKKEYFISDLAAAATIMNDSMNILDEKLKAEVQRGEAQVPPKVVIGTVKEDIHDLGKNIIAMVFKAAGYDVYDLGVDVSSEQFIEKVKEVNADVLAMSALLLLTAPYMKQVIDDLRREGLREKVYVIVGGIPVNEAFSKYVGADAYAETPMEGLRKVEEYLTGR